jgi:hypothetical protein
MKKKISHWIYSPDSYSWTNGWNWTDSYFSLTRQPEELNDGCRDKPTGLSHCTVEICYTYSYVPAIR